MKIHILKIILFLAIFSQYSLADEYVVIANKNIDKLSIGQIKAIFLKKIAYSNEIKVLPVNLNSRDEIRSSFEKNILKMKLSRLKSFWTKQHYLGHRPPITMKSQNTMKAFVKKVEGAIGYINIQNLDDSVNVIYKWRD